MDILILLFVISLIVIDSNVRQRMFAALAAAVSLNTSVDITSDNDVTTNDDDDKNNDTHSDTSDTTNDNDDTTHVTVSRDAIDAVSRLVAANVISASEACKIAFNVSQRGNAAVYRAVRKRAAELKKQSTTSHSDEIVDIRSDGRVIRCDSNGKYYVVHADGRKEFISINEVTQ